MAAAALCRYAVSALANGEYTVSLTRGAGPMDNKDVRRDAKTHPFYPR
jgi:hypothetical protein